MQGNRLKIIVQKTYNSYQTLMEESSNFGSLVERLTGRIGLKERNQTELEQFMYHIQQSADKIIAACQEIIRQYKLAIDDADLNELLFGLA